MQGEVVVGGAGALHSLEGGRNDIEGMRERKQLCEQGAAAVVKLIALAGEARRGDERLRSAEVDVHRIEDEGYGLRELRRRRRARRRCGRLHGKAEIG